MVPVLSNKDKCINLLKVAPSPTPQCSSYRKGSLLVALDYGRQLYYTKKIVDILQTTPDYIDYCYFSQSIQIHLK